MFGRSMPSIVTLIPQVSRYAFTRALSQPLTPSQREHIPIIFQKRCCFQDRATAKENKCKKYFFKKANFNLFWLLRKVKYTNFRTFNV